MRTATARARALDQTRFVEWFQGWRRAYSIRLRGVPQRAGLARCALQRQAVVLVVAGGMSAAFLAMNQTALHLGIEDEVRGRVLSIYLLTWGLLPVGQLLVGALARRVGTPAAIVLAGNLAKVCIAAIAWRFPAPAKGNVFAPAEAPNMVVPGRSSAGASVSR